MASCLKLTAELLLLNRPKSMARMRMMKSKKPPTKRSSLLMLFISFRCVSYKLFQAAPVGIFRQVGKDVKSLLLESQHPRSGVFHATVGFHESNDLGHFLGIFVVVFNQIDDPSFFGPTNLFQCMDEWQGKFFLLDVVAQRLTDIIDAEVKQIIFYLEGHTYFLTTLAHLLDHLVAGIC